MMCVDLTEWKEMLMLTDDLDMTLRHLLFEYSAIFDSKGRSLSKTKVLSKTCGISERDVRKGLIKAKDLGWLEAIELDGRKGYKASLPEELA